MRVFPPALRRHRGHGSFEDLQQSLLDPFPGDIPGDRGVLRLTGDLVDLVNIDNPLFRLFHIIIGGLDQFEEDILHILTDITGFRQRGGIGNGKGNIQDLGQGLRKQGFTAPGRPQEQDIALLELDIVKVLLGFYPLIVVVYCHRQGLFCLFLPNDILVQNRLDLFGFGEIPHVQGNLVVQFLVNNFVAEFNTFVADVDTGTGD